MEVDISKKVSYMIKFGAIGILTLAVLCSVGIWAWQKNNAYLTVKDASVTSALVNTKTNAAGTIEEILVQDGEQVKAGQVLAKIKIKITDDQIAQLEQTLETAKKHYTQVLAGTTTSEQVNAGGGEMHVDTAGAQAEVDRAARAKDRMAQLFAIGAVSAVQNEQAQAAYQEAVAALGSMGAGTGSSSSVSYQSLVVPSSPEAVKAAQLQVTQAQAALETAKKDKDSTEIMAPVDGTVYLTDLQVGADVAAGQTILNIGNANNMWVEMHIDLQQKDKIRLGQFVTYIIEGQTQMQGTIFEIIDPTEASGASAEATEDQPEDQSIVAKISLPADLDITLKQGTAATVKVALK
ncbi:HlyD family secretion protein [Propionispira raffinosivorans]|uniref:HlyD family secretion protein n=1 Tax=Propionispira raffinosivorans TaxID=86959 RepID=UPI000371C916|nr:HlyD family efflux transporter periplasmic adaptor subunit [Propionispira raffinosivorans]